MLQTRVIFFILVLVTVSCNSVEKDLTETNCGQIEVYGIKNDYYDNENIELIITNNRKYDIQVMAVLEFYYDDWYIVNGGFENPNAGHIKIYDIQKGESITLTLALEELGKSKVSRRTFRILFKSKDSKFEDWTESCFSKEFTVLSDVIQN